MRRLVVLLTLLLPAVATAQGTGTTVTGNVTDRVTGSPLSGVHVFVPGTTRGTTTTADGTFALDPGEAHALFVTRVRYETAVVCVGAAPLVVALRPARQELADVGVEAASPEAWRLALRVFEPVFLGGTPNAAETHLVGPEVLDLRYEDHVLEATAEAPFVVENDALGYRVTVHALALAAAGGEHAWDGLLAFEDACAPTCPAEIAAARERAYAGSIGHFYDALVAGRLAEEGFAVDAVADLGRGDSPTEAVRRLLGQKEPTVLNVVEVPGGWAVAVGGALRVTYTGEPDGRPGREGPQVSWLRPADSVLRLGPDRRPPPGADVRHAGYWDWERVADLLPSDYAPEQNRPRLGVEAGAAESEAGGPR